MSETALQIVTKPAHLEGNGTAHAAVIGKTQAVADRINGHLAKSVEAIIAVGAELIAATERLPHGEFARLFKNHPDAVAHPLRISKRTAEVYMSIAGHRVLADAQHVAHLPPSWGTLGVLARLPAPVLEAALRDGVVTVEMERSAANRLVALGKAIDNRDVGDPESWRQYWKEMPELVQEAQPPFKTVHVHFEDRAALEDFAKLVGQPITAKTRFIWHPAHVRAPQDSKYYAQWVDDYAPGDEGSAVQEPAPF